MANNSNDQFFRPMQYVLVGIAIALSVLVVAVTMFVFLTDI